MVMTCKELWREVSNYVDDTISPEMREKLESHLAYCQQCGAIIDGVRNVIILVADGRVFALPSGLGARLKARLMRDL